MSYANKLLCCLFVLGLLVAAFGKPARAETVTDADLTQRGCTMTMVTAEYPEGVWSCPAPAEGYEPLPPVVPEDEIETGCVLTHKNIGAIFRGSFGEGITTKEIAESALEQYRKCG